jgi:hypothetical protein
MTKKLKRNICEHDMTKKRTNWGEIWSRCRLIRHKCQFSHFHFSTPIRAWQTERAWPPYSMIKSLMIEHQRLVFFIITVSFFFIVLSFVLLSSTRRDSISSSPQSVSSHNKWNLLDISEKSVCRNTAQGKVFITDHTGNEKGTPLYKSRCLHIFLYISYLVLNCFRPCLFARKFEFCYRLLSWQSTHKHRTLQLRTLW